MYTRPSDGQTFIREGTTNIPPKNIFSNLAKMLRSADTYTTSLPLLSFLRTGD